MMPLTPYTIPGTSSTVLLRTCDGCGAPNAPYGSGSATKDPSKVKVWCGPTGCRKEEASRPCPRCGGESMHYANCPDAGDGEVYALSAARIDGVLSEAVLPQSKKDEGRAA